MQQARNRMLSSCDRRQYFRRRAGRAKVKRTFKVLMRFIVPIFFSAVSVLGPIIFLQQKNALELIEAHGVAAIGDAMNPLATAALFFCSGCILRAIDKRFWLSASALMIAVFPILVLIEVISGIGHHNLFPFEIGIYVILGLPAIVGAAFVGVIRRGWSNESKQDSSGP